MLARQACLESGAGTWARHRPGIGRRGSAFADQQCVERTGWRHGCGGPDAARGHYRADAEHS